MAENRRTLTALAALLPAGVLGLSASLASINAAEAARSADTDKPGSVAERLQSIRASVSGAMDQMPQEEQPFVKVDPEKRLAWWGNGWHNWGNGWHNWGNVVPFIPVVPWGNGWNNWGNGWRNGWHNW